jgi:hypothetical protein
METARKLWIGLLALLAVAIAASAPPVLTLKSPRWAENA